MIDITIHKGYAHVHSWVGQINTWIVIDGKGNRFEKRDNTK